MRRRPKRAKFLVGALALLAVLLAAAPSAWAQLWLTHGEASDYQGEPAVRFQVYHAHGLSWCVGYLYLTANRIGYEVLGPGGYAQDSFVRPRSDVQVAFLGTVAVRGPLGMRKQRGLFSPAMTGTAVAVQITRGRKYDFYLARNIGADGSAEFDSVSAWPLEDAWKNFEQALERARKQWNPNAPPPAPPPAPPAPEPPKTATLSIEAQPGGAEFYIDDEFKGSTSGEGKIKVSGLAPGEHRLRLSRKDYQEWSKTLTLEPGENRTIEAHLEEAKPVELVVLEPAAGAAVETATVKVRGTATHPSGIARVEVGGRAARLETRSPQAMEFVLDDLALTTGDNDIEIVAKSAAGPEARTTLKLKRVEPPSGILSLADVLKLLEGGVSPVRVEAIVKERGVNFALTDEIDKQLRDAGATPDLLLAIAKARK